MDTFRHEHIDSDFILGPGESQLREDLADAMREPSMLSRESGRKNIFVFDLLFLFTSLDNNNHTPFID
jgi:hypothetical protein